MVIRDNIVFNFYPVWDFFIISPFIWIFKPFFKKLLILLKNYAKIYLYTAKQQKTQQ